MNTYNADIIEPKPQRSLPRWIWLGCVLFVIAAALHSADESIGGGDTWVALACGRYQLGDWPRGPVQQSDRSWQMRLLDKFAVHITWHDPFGARTRPYNPQNKEDVGWVNQNWLTHTLFYQMKTAWGENSIVVYKFVQAVLTALFTYGAARALGAHPLLSAGAAAFGILLSRSFVDLRPNVSSILFAAIMIMLLAYWKKGSSWALAGMFPVMVIWANVHGGFIYAIMIFALMLAANLFQKFLGSLHLQSVFQVRIRDVMFLAAAAGMVLITPAVFSPFGFENLAHPFIIAAGAEGKLWREVIEWRPIWDTSGFGHAAPYVWFLSILGAVFLTWWVLFFCKPHLPQARGRRHRKVVEQIPWPKIDLAQLAVMGITFYMSVQSRRFIFLGGVVLSPYLAAHLQEIANMLQILRAHKQKLPLQLNPLPRIFAWLALAASLIATAIMGWVFYHSVCEIYYTGDAKEMSMFRKMVGITDQPVEAVKYFDALKLKGLVFNEWTQGGFVAFGQTPDPQTGEPPCKVFMDGRAQAAYTLQHYQHWKLLNAQGKLLGQPLAVAQGLKRDILRLDRLDAPHKILEFLNSKEFIYRQLFPQDYLRWRNNPDKNTVASELKNYETKYRRYFLQSFPNSDWLDKIDQENINVVLLDVAPQKSESIVELLRFSDRWETITGGRYFLFLRKDHELNKEAFAIVRNIKMLKTLPNQPVEN